ncbi:heterokaryon incompatibility protein-domain-containing protein [Paraphoma chrysanthemicola]|uniref:Heterokaryon incompatibility protein-domain-containing protein n=1 Tax=Paraphoma chrysanthemicola TaxID=798071 RepID=A0A8K0REG6_9PLEO|nr:heterokaryon incompatibility protein-domain-containing protein [Paraphoma chrysanthemicola]
MCAHYRTILTLEISAAQGCHVCLAFWDQLSDAEKEALRVEESKAMMNKEARKDDGGNVREDEKVKEEPRSEKEEEDYFEWLTFTILQRDEYCGGDYVLSLAFSGDGIDWGKVSARKDVALGLYVLQEITDDAAEPFHSVQASSTASEDSWATAMTWFQKCRSMHTACNENRDKPAWYPTRLLDIADIGSDDGLIRLIQTTEVATLSGPYCTLSHCWGKVHIIQLKRLPKTFREAILAAKRLGVSYIWIDSLCIVQDDLSDWFREAALMHKVYSYSLCNLSASASKDSSEGLYRNRNPRTLDTTRAELNVAGLGSSITTTRCEMHDYFFWKHNVSQCTVNRRAWVTQERLLAPRVLHFGRYQIFWECREHDACESYPEGLPSLFVAQTTTNFKALDPAVYAKRIAGEGRDVDADTASYRIWNAIVWTYSRTALTVAGDKLIALSGIAKRMMPTMDDEYVAGMWRKNLGSALLWHVDDKENIDSASLARPSTYRAPTWSWASLDCAIATDTPSERGLSIEVCDVVLEYATDDTTGAITSGWLDLCGFLRPMCLAQRDYGAGKRWYMVVNGTIVRPQDESLEEFDRLGPMLYFDVPPPYDEAFDSDNATQSLFFMVGRMPIVDNDYMLVLLLRLVDLEGKLFERIGVAVSGAGDDREMLLAAVDEETKRGLPCLRYENGQHTIRIF